MNAPSYFKILTFGSRGTKKLLDGPVYVSEKVDGSQFRFGVHEGRFYIASHHKDIHIGGDYGMFREAVEHVLSKRDIIVAQAERLGTDELWYFTEYLQAPRHNVLEYDRVPQGHLALWALMADGDYLPQLAYAMYAAELGIEVIPRYLPKEYTRDELESLLDEESFLGGPKVEGVVITNENQNIAIGPRLQPLICKLVRPKFKEQHRQAITGGKSKIEQHMGSYTSEARWLKAIQRRREDGELLGTPQDIGPLLRSINQDLEEEEKENIKEFLWRHYRKDYLRACTRGFPEWYKAMVSALDSEKEDTGNGHA